MLKIKAPIEFKCNTDVTTVGDSFGEHIRANYGVMGVGLNGEELMHLVSRPPEIYLGEGGITNLVNESNIENRQYNKVEIVNNFLNRVLVSTDANLTYQDRVFITNVLNQLGIKDEQHFMQQVYQIKKEINNTEELINLYWDNLYHLESLVNDYREGDTNITNTEESHEDNSVLHLHEDIMNRLMTGAIYQIIENFSDHTSGDTVITNEEYKISEQNRITQNILLNRLQNVVRHEAAPLTFRHENIFEEMIGGDTEITEENVNSEVNSAILLNMIDNIYQSRHDSFLKGGDKLYHMESTFYEGADNTIQRITHNIEQNFVHAGNVINTEERVAQLGDEIDIINNILSESHTEQLRVLTDADYRQYRNTSYRGGDVSSKADITVNTYENVNVNNKGDNISVTGDRINEGDININEDNLIVHREGDVTDIDAVTEIENINRDLTIINEQNIARNEEYQRNLTRITNQMSKEPVIIGQGRRVAESLKALENPVEFMKEIRAEKAGDKKIDEIRESAIIEALPARERETTRLIKEYLERPEVFRERRIVTENNIAQLMTDVNRVERENRIHEERNVSEQVERETVTELVTETVREMRQSQPAIRIEERPAREISLVHKSQETLVNEEIIDEIVAQNYRIEQQNERIETFVTNNQTETKTVVNNVEHHVVEEQNRDVTEAVKRSIQGQMDAITDKVYNKLSKRLANEKIRRGL